MAFEGIDVNVEDAVDPFAAVAEDTYTLQITGYSDDDSKAGDPMLTIICQIVGHEDHTGHQLRDWCVFGGKGQKGGTWKFQQWCSALGLEPAHPSEFDFDEWVGMEVEALVTKNPPSGEYGESNSIKSFV